MGLTSVVALDGDLTGTGLPAQATVTIPDPRDLVPSRRPIIAELARRDARPVAVVCWTDRFVRSTAGTGTGVGAAWIVHGPHGRGDVEILTIENDPTTAARALPWPTYVQIITGDATDITRR